MDCKETCQNYKPKEPEKTCGNCGWFFNGKLKYNPNYGTCLNKENGWHNTTLSNRRVDDIDCKGWKPIVCETCQGTGKICDKCGVCWDKCKNNANIGIPELIPCPTCQKPKEERLMMPVQWNDISDSCSRLEIIVLNQAKPLSTIIEMDGCWIWSNTIDKKKYKDKEKTQKAVEKALGIKRG